MHQINFLSGLGADRWIVSGYRDAFEDLGHQFFFLTSNDDLANSLERVRPDILMLAVDKLTYDTLPVFKRAKERGVKIFLWLDSMFAERPDLVDILTKEDPANFYCGETEPEWMDHFVKITGKKYTLTPNAANKKLHYSTEPVEKYKCDIAFLGANLSMKKEAFRRLLNPLRKKYNVQIYGPGWTIRDNFLRGLAVLARKFSFMKLNDLISKNRLSLPVEDENKLYSSVKICLNIHEARTDRMSSHMILNERTFKIPACGGFEICDNVPPLRRYFSEDEVVMAKNDEDWFKKIDYYLTHESEKVAIQKKGTERALRDHTYHNRAQRIIDLVSKV